MQSKICTKCNQEKSIVEFSKFKHGKYGVKSACKYCDKQYRQDNAEHIAEYSKQYYQDNAEHIAEYSKQYYQDKAIHLVAQQKQYYQANKEHILEYNKQWREDNKGQRAEYQKQYRLDNSGRQKQYRLDNAEHIAATHKQWCDDNPEYSKQWQTDNAEHRAEYMKQYRQTPKGKAVARASNQNRRAHKLKNGGKHTGAQILALFDLQSGKCPYCKSKLNKTGKNKYHVDHIVPLSKGGSNSIDNIQLLCTKCNLSKYNKLPEEFAAEFNKLF